MPCPPPVGLKMAGGVTESWNNSLCRWGRVERDCQIISMIIAASAIYCYIARRVCYVQTGRFFFRVIYTSGADVCVCAR